MKVSKHLHNGTIVTAEGDTIVEVWEQLAKLTVAFGEYEAVKDGKTSSNFEYRVRKVGDNNFYELYCTDLKAKLPFGVGKGDNLGDLYPKRLKTDDKGKAFKDENDKVTYLPDRGWRRWNPETKTEE